jgi:hypothetical protein
MRAAPEDRMLSDDEWAGIAHEVMHRTGLSPYGQEDEAVRWVAIRHGDDHIHLVTMLARQDGGKPSVSWERYKVRAACIAAEQRYGLRSTAPGDRTAPTDSGRIGKGGPPRPRRSTACHVASSGHHRCCIGRQRAGVLRPPGSIRNPGPQAVQHAES